MAKKGVFVYIDAENLKGSVCACGYTAPDYVKLYNWLKTSKQASRIYLYAPYNVNDSSAVADLDKLERLGYIVRRKQIMQYPPEFKTHELKCPSCNKKAPHTIKRNGRSKGNCDSELTLDVINDGARHKYSSVVVFSGDGDFARMHEYVSEILKRNVVVYSPMKGVPGRRTSTIIKTLHNNGTITLESLEGVLVNFAVK
jgi:uncharacterized LabA/DUF88 family protein